MDLEFKENSFNDMIYENIQFLLLYTDHIHWIHLFICFFKYLLFSFNYSIIDGNLSFTCSLIGSHSKKFGESQREIFFFKFYFYFYFLIVNWIN